MSFDYYIHNNRLYRFEKGKKLHGDISTLQVFDERDWLNDSKYIKSFMNHYVTGWIDEDDAISNYSKAKEELAKKKYVAVKDFAIESHKNQKYGIYNYEVHLINVVGVLFRNKVFINSENYSVLASAWLHDILEDTSISKDEFINRFGEEVFEIVWSLTDGQGDTRAERKEKMYDKLIKSQNGIIVKLADRIANLEFSIIANNTKHIDRYVKENEELNSRLKNNIQTELGNKLLVYLNCLVQNAPD